MISSHIEINKLTTGNDISDRLPTSAVGMIDFNHQKVHKLEQNVQTAASLKLEEQ